MTSSATVTIDSVIKQFVGDYLRTKLGAGEPPPVAVANPHVVDVTTVGAKGDGVMDDADAFIESFKLARNSGRPVIVPGGRVYVIGSELDVNYPYAAITGIGNPWLRRKNNSGPMTLLRLLAPHARLSGLAFAGNSVNNKGNDSGELLVYGDDARLSNLSFGSGEYISLQVLGSRVSVRDSDFQSEITANCKFGVYAGGRATDLFVDNCTFTRFRLNAILTAPYAPGVGASRTRIAHCRFIENNDDGAGQVDLQQWATVINCVFSHAPNGTSFGIECQGGGIIVGNVLNGNGSNRSGIEIQGGQGYEVSGNFVEGYENGLLLEEIPGFQPTDYINEHDNHWNCPVKIRGSSRGRNNRFSHSPINN